MVNKTKMTPLPNDFVPGPYDVICAKGKIAKCHSGNKFYKQLIQQAIPLYSNADSKFKKSMIVSEVVDEIRSRSNANGGGFVKRKSGIWYEVGDHISREKVGQSLRDGLSGQYKSSARAKKRRQEIVSAGVADQFESLIKRNSFLTRRINKLSDAAATSVEHQNLQGTISDWEEAEVNQTFSQINFELLEAFKKNDDLLQQFSESEHCHKLLL